MKLRESGMPQHDYWESLFDVPLIVERFGFNRVRGNVAELGCGYGTFTLPVAASIGGVVHTFDIEPEMAERTSTRAREAGLTNVRIVTRDVAADGFDLDPGSCDAVLLFNILHGEHPVELLREAERLLGLNGFVAVTHWRTDIQTPRGPPADIRPSPAQVVKWAAEAGMSSVTPTGAMDLPPWHYGLKLTRT